MNSGILALLRIPHFREHRCCFRVGLFEFGAGVDVVVVVLPVVVESALHAFREVFVMIHRCVIALPHPGLLRGGAGGFHACVTRGIHV